jgi:hypothetical protein
MGIFIASSAPALAAAPLAATAAPAHLAANGPGQPSAAAGPQGPGRGRPSAKPAGTGTIAMPRNSDELKFYRDRLIFASVVLVVILVGGFLAAVLKLEAWSTLLLHSFELLLGIFVGMLGGEIASRKV